MTEKRQQLRSLYSRSAQLVALPQGAGHRDFDSKYSRHVYLESCNMYCTTHVLLGAQQISKLTTALSLVVLAPWTLRAHLILNTPAKLNRAEASRLPASPAAGCSASLLLCIRGNDQEDFSCSCLVESWFWYMIKSLPGILHLLQRQRIGALNLHASDEPACCSFCSACSSGVWGARFQLGDLVAGALPACSKTEQVRVVVFIA